MIWNHNFIIKFNSHSVRIALPTSSAMYLTWKHCLWIGMIAMSPAVHSQDGVLLYNQALTVQDSAPDSAFVLADSAYQRAYIEEDHKLQADINLLLGNIFYAQGAFPRAMEYYLEAKTIFENIGDMKGQADALLCMGRVRYYTNEPELSLRDFRLALNKYNKLKDRQHIAETYGEIGHVHEKSARFDSAYVCQNNALAIYEELNDKKGIAHILENLGSISEDLKHYEEALADFLQAAAINRTLDNRIGLVSNLNNIGDIYRKTDRLDSAFHYTTKALDLATELDLLYQKSAALRNIGKTYELAGNFEMALRYKEESRELLDDIYSQENSRQMAILQTLYELERKNREIEVLENERKVESVTRTAAVATSGLLFLLIIVLISHQRLKAKKNQLLIDQQWKLHISELENTRLNEERLRIELQHKQLQERQLNLELETQQRSPSAGMLQLIEKNQLLEDVRDGINGKNNQPTELNRHLNKFVTQIDYSFNHDRDWEEFRHSFEQIHDSFFDRLKEINPELTVNDLRICALMRINIRSKEVAMLLGISHDSLRVVRHRLRKKLGLDQEQNLRQFLLNI